MGIYTARDIKSTFSGDISLNGRGDIDIGSPLESHKALANFWLRTDFGEYRADRSVGCNLGSFIGAPNTEESHSSMEYLVKSSLTREIFSPVDVDATVVAFDVDEALAVVNIAGTFDNGSGKFISVDNEKLIYFFPYIDANPTPALGV